MVYQVRIDRRDGSEIARHSFTEDVWDRSVLTEPIYVNKREITARSYRSYDVALKAATEKAKEAGLC